MNELEFIKELSKLNIALTDNQLNDLKIYKDMLIEYNKKFNLTAITEEKNIYLKHFYDSLTIAKVINLNENLKVMDIGTGAGFPGLVLKIIYPNLNITLVDANNKKITFLNEVIKKLNLENITCIHSRAENLPLNYKEHFDIIVTRAVASLRILVELSIPYLKVNGFFLSMKGQIDNELEESKNTIRLLNSKIINITSFCLPFEKSKRNIIMIKKEEKTSKIYPRSYAKIIKKPLN